jgi:hypothetical protein
LAKCSAITRNGARCRGIPIDASGLCHAHHPDRAEARRRAGSKGGKRGGRGRPSSELARLQERFEELAEQVLTGKIDKGVGAVAAQLLNGARACVATRLKAIEQEDILERIEELEEIAARQNECRRRNQAW